MANKDVFYQSVVKYNTECGECKTIQLPQEDKDKMVKKARKGLILLDTPVNE